MMMNGADKKKKKKYICATLYYPKLVQPKSLGGEKKTVVIHRTYKSRSRIINPFKSNKFFVVTSPMAAQIYCQKEIQI